MEIGGIYFDFLPTCFDVVDQIFKKNHRIFSGRSSMGRVGVGVG